MKALIFFSVLATLVLSSSEIYGQNKVAARSPDQTTRKIVTIPQLQPPKEVVESGIGGTVRAKITVDEAGNVTSVDDVVGPGAVCREVTRADVVAMRSAAKEAAMTARFTPASVAGELFSTWLSFEFPGKEETSNFVAAPSEPVSDGQRYTINGDANLEPSQAPPPDYRGPVNVGGTSPSNVPKSIAGGVLNGKVYVLPKPPYPAAARAVRASGAVHVQVLIDESGEVFMARPVSGHPLLRSVSVTAACGSRFSPTRLSGHPVRVTGIITYNFVP